MYLKLKTVIIEKFRSFCKHCTIHGFYYFGERRPRLVYVTWSIIIFSGLALCMFLSQMIWAKFSIDPTFTVVENTRHSITDIQFPSVTVCSNEIVYQPNTENITAMLLQRGFKKSDIEDFYKSFSAVKNTGYIPNPNCRKIHAFLHDLGFTFNKIVHLFKKPCNDILQTCRWRSKTYNCSDMFRDIFTYVGYCCKFDIDYFRKNAELGTIFTGGVEESEALHISVDINNENHDGLISNGHVTMYILNPTVNMTLTDASITLSQSAYFDVNVHVWAIDSSDDVKALSVKSRRCIIDEDTEKGYRYNTYQECVTELILKKVVNICHCLPFRYTASDLETEDYPSCTWDRLMCIHQSIAKLESDIQIILAEEICMTRCDHVQYETETSFIGLQTENSNTSSAHIAVHFSSNTCLKYRREVLYTWDQMLANLGGIFGLCLGGSIISIIEIVWFLLDLLFTVIFVFKENKINPHENNKVFTISKKSPLTKDVRKIKKPGKYKFVN